MKINKYHLLLSVFILLYAFYAVLLSGCNKQKRREIKTLNASIIKAIEKVKNKYAPDRRTAIWDIRVRKGKNNWVLTGKTNVPGAKSDLINTLEGRGVMVTDSIVLLPVHPDSSYAMVRVSVANMRLRPSYAAELVTQATLGMPLRVYEKSGGWYRVQTPDAYISWVNGGAITLLTKAASDSIARLPKIIFLEIYGFGYEAPALRSGRVSDLVAGDILTYIDQTNGYLCVGYPDGRMAWIHHSSGKLFADWLRGLNQVEDELVRTARSLKGIPYLWGGTSAKMMDCSGFTKTVFFLNGLIIPRDASQQSRTGVLIDSIRSFDKLQPGDLLFFGKKALKGQEEKVVHVGLWLGEGRFIHASGTVHISSLLPGAEDYDAYNDQRYLKAKRLLKYKGLRIINLKIENIFEIDE